MPFALTNQDHLLIDNSSYRNTSSLIINKMRTSGSTVDTLEEEYLFPSPYMTIIVGTIAMIMSLVTIIGNVLVITAFIIDKNLRKYSNYFILNLSIADLLIGLLIPPYAPFLLYNYNWKLGQFLCTVWLVLDYVVGSASVLCIVVISLDRYWMVSRGLKYISKQKISRAITIMLTVWTIAFLNYAPAIIFWELLTSSDEESSNKTVNSDTVCQVGFHDNLGYLTATACVEFFLPFISICSLNLMVYLNIRKRSKGLIRTKTKESKNKTKLTNTTDDSIKQKAEPKESPAQTNGEPLNKTEASKLITSNNVDNPIATEDTVKTNNSNYNNNSHSQLKPMQSETDALNVSWKNFKASQDNTPVIKKDKNLTKDKKAARSLFILVFTFVVCWAPYTFLTLIKSVCNTCVRESVYEVTFWLLWFNSTLNPILYPFLHVQFRKAFAKIFRNLFCCLGRKKNQSFYQAPANQKSAKK